MTEQDQGKPASSEADPQVTSQDDQEAQDKQEPKTLTWEEHQRELRRIGKKEKSEGRTTERAALLQELGVENLDEAKARLEAYQTIEAETETEADRLQKETESLKAERERLKAEKQEALQRADETLRDSELRSALIAEGADASKVRKILNDPDLEKPEVEDGELPGVSEYVEAAKKEWDHLFKTTQTVPESPEPFEGVDPAKDEEARAAVRRQYTRSF